MVVGSDKFNDRAFVFGVLDAFRNFLAENAPIEKIYSSNFSGVSLFAKEWAHLNKIDFESHNFFGDDKTNPFFDQVEIPPAVIQNDSYYQKGKDFFMQRGINMLILMPNASGELGVQTKNIERMAVAAGLNESNGILNAQDLYQSILETNKQLKSKTAHSGGVSNLGSMGKI